MFGFLRRRETRPGPIAVSETLTVAMQSGRTAVIARHGKELRISHDEAQKLGLWLLDFYAWCEDSKAVPR